MNLDNLLVYCAQVCVVVAVSGVVSKLTRLKSPDVRLVWWQLVLGACLALPAMRPWTVPQVFVSAADGPSIPLAPVTRAASSFHVDWAQAVTLVLAAGITWRLVLLLVGFVRLSRYRKNSEPLDPPSTWGFEAELLVSPEISGPVTFGIRRPVVLLPTRFRDFDEATVNAILCHEILHVRRKDWLFTVAEELVRAALWFHPAVWWVLAEIQLAREETVDQAVIEMTKSRDSYVDALLTIAGGGRESELAPAPLFLRRRHLKQRVVSILGEVGMSKGSKIAAMAASVAMLAASCWFTTAALPLQAAPQEVVDSTGVAVQPGGAEVMHRSAIAYPRQAIEKGVEGQVVAQVRIDASGNVSDASILSGPDELRRSVLQSVLGWHFVKDAANSTRQVTVQFRLPEADLAQARLQQDQKKLAAMSNEQLFRDFQSDRVTQPRPSSSVVPQIVHSIRVQGVSDRIEREILDRIGVSVGSVLTPEKTVGMVRAVGEYDNHLVVSVRPSLSGKADVVIAAPVSIAPVTTTEPARAPSISTLLDPRQPLYAPSTPEQIRVGGNVQQTNLINQPKPAYPSAAKQARVQGVVRFEAVIGKDGAIKDLKLLSGHPLLVQASIEAVQQWMYKPTLLNGNPVEVITTIDVNFTLSE